MLEVSLPDGVIIELRFCFVSPSTGAVVTHTARCTEKFHPLSLDQARDRALRKASRASGLADLAPVQMPLPPSR